MTLELNIQAALLDGYRVETLDNRLFFMVRDTWRRGPYTTEIDAWRHGGIPDYSGNKIEAIQFAQRLGVKTNAPMTSTELVQVVIANTHQIEGAPEFVQTMTEPEIAEEPKRKRKRKVSDDGDTNDTTA